MGPSVIAAGWLQCPGRGRPPIGDEASSAYSVRLPDELVALVDERSAMDGVPRGETIRRALIEYLTKS